MASEILPSARNLLRQRYVQAKTTAISFVDNHILKLAAEGLAQESNEDRRHDAFPGFPLSSAPEPEESIGPYRDLVLEIIGTHPASSKTRLLYQVAVEALLAGRSEGAVLWIVADAHFDYPSFCTVLSAKLLESGICAQDANRLMAAHVRRLHIFQPQTSQALRDVIEGLHGYVLDDPTGSLGMHSLRAVIVGGLSTFHCEDRREDLDIHPEYLPPAATRSVHRVRHWSAIVEALQKLQSSFDCIIVASNTAFITKEHATSGPRVQNHLPAAWNQFVTVRLIVIRDRTPRLEPSLGAVEALEEGVWRREALHEDSFTAWVEVADDEGAPAHTRRSLSYRACKDGILVQSD